MRWKTLGLIVPLVLLLADDRRAPGEVFVLNNGGRVHGQWVNRDQAPRGDYVIRTVHGGQITLQRTRVKEVLPDRRPVEVEYERIAPGYADTVDGQWALAEWCRENLLLSHRNKHLGRIIELEPDHPEARRLLRYQKKNGRWVTNEQRMTEDGYIYYVHKGKGRWRTSQEIELLEKGRKLELAGKDWAEKIKRWRGWLGGKKTPAARENLLKIRDPAAVWALARNLEQEPLEAVKKLYIEALANIGTPAAIQALARCSMHDRSEEVRLTCLDYLEKGTHPDVVAYYVGKLGSKLNNEVNLAAVGIRHMKDPSAVGPLIGALITTHKFKIVTSNPGSTSASFPTGGTPGGGGLSVGSRPKIITRQFQNQPVLDALVTLTGQNFNFDQRAWKYWYASQQDRIELDARRD